MRIGKLLVGIVIVAIGWLVYAVVAGMLALGLLRFLAAIGPP